MWLIPGSSTGLDPYLLCVILTSFLHCEEHCKESQAVFKINKLSFSTIFSNKIPATRSSCKNCYPEKVFKDGTRPSAQVYSHVIFDQKTNQIPKWVFRQYI